MGSSGINLGTEGFNPVGSSPLNKWKTAKNNGMVDKSGRGCGPPALAGLNLPTRSKKLLKTLGRKNTSSGRHRRRTLMTAVAAMIPLAQMKKNVAAGKGRRKRSGRRKKARKKGDGKRRRRRRRQSLQTNRTVIR